MGDKGGRSDMDRVGLFQEMTYVTIGDKYKSLGQGVTFNEAAGKGKQMFPGGSKDRSAKQDGYFSDKFDRIMDGEGYTDTVKLRRRYRMDESKKNLSKAFIPTNGDKTMNGLGTYFGTLKGSLPAFSPVRKARSGTQTSQRNFFTNPGKKGTGYGYISVTMGKYPTTLTDPFDNDKQIYRKEFSLHKSKLKAGAFRLNMHPSNYFDENPYKSDKSLSIARASGSGKNMDMGTTFKPSNPGKLLAGMKAGTFDPYPSHSVDPYGIKYKRPVHVVNNSGRTFIPNQGPKSTPCKSIVDQNVVRSVNITNYRTVGRALTVV